MARKSFKITEGNDKEVELAVLQPLAEHFEESDRAYANKISSMVKDSVNKRFLLRREVESFLKEQKLWTEVDETAIKKIQLEIDALLLQLRKGGIKVSEVRKLCLEIADKRAEMVKIMSKRRIFDDSTIESFAETDRNDYLIYICTVYNKDGRNYWQSFEDMKNDKLSEAYRKASTISYEIIYGVNPEFEKTLPENRLLMKLGFVDKDLNFVDRKTGEFVDREGKPLIQIAEETLNKFNSLQGEIAEETPFIDDDTNKPINENLTMAEGDLIVENIPTKEKRIYKERKIKKTEVAVS